MTALRVGSVPFLNERPLTAALEGQPDVTLDRRPPGPLAERLLAGAYDAALIPVAEQLRHGLRALGTWGIVGDGPIRSVQVWHASPAGTWRRVRVPAHSRSSVLLLRALLSAWGMRDVTLTPDAPEAPGTAPPAEPTLWIGDAALRAAERDWPSTDLGAAWRELTGLPFVFARWVAAPGLPADRATALAARLDDSARAGLARRAALAAAGAAALGIPVASATRYLTEHVRYAIDARGEAGQAEFGRRARALA